MTGKDGSIDGSTPLRRRNRRGEGAKLRWQLIEAATEALAQSAGPEVLTLREVARRVGVAPASIYHHFANIDELTDNVLAQRFSDLTHFTEELVQTQATAQGRLVVRCWAYVTWGLRSPGHYRVLFGGRARNSGTLPGSDDGDRLLDGLMKDLTAVRHELARQARSNGDDATAGILLWTALHGIVSLSNDKFDMTLPPPDELVALTLALHVDVEVGTTRKIMDELAE